MQQAVLDWDMRKLAALQMHMHYEQRPGCCAKHFIAAMPAGVAEESHVKRDHIIIVILVQHAGSPALKNDLFTPCHCGWVTASENCCAVREQKELIDEVQGIDTCANTKVKHEVTAAISNSFGFGGHNSVVAFAPFK